MPPTGLAKCLRFNGTSQLAYISNPAFAAATVGSFGIWVRPQALLSSDGIVPIAALNVSTAGDVSTMDLLLRRNTGYGDTVTHFDVLHRETNSGTPFVKSAPDSVVVGDWYLFGIDSDTDLWLNGSLVSPVYWSINHWSSGYFGNIDGSAHDFSFGAFYRAGSASNYGQVDVGHNRSINRLLTSTEWAEWQALGPTGDPSTLSFASDFNGGYNLAGSLASIVSGEDLTAIGSPTYVDI